MTALAGGGTALVYGAADVAEVSDDCLITKEPLCEWALQSGEVRRVDGSSSSVIRDAPAPALLAVTSNSVALAPAETTWAGDAAPRAAFDGAVEIRDLQTGTLTSAYVPAGR